ncbi:MAG: GNAT family N-acetyltransferase [Anaerolineae bacterium]|nr:GNAT family N-acetyltransferase [Anaerolineae bacterium]
MEEVGRIVFEPEQHGTRVAYVEDGKHISDLQVYDRWMWLGAARLHVGCIGGVGTSERSRNRGLARRVLSDAVEWMATRYDLSMLFGIPDFYSRFGFSTCIPEHRVSLSLRDIECARMLLPSRPYVPEDRPRLLELHAKRFAGSVGAFDRTGSWFDPQRRSSGYGRRAAIRLILDGHGRPCGYLTLDDTPQQATVSEVVGRTPEVYETALALVAEAVRGRGQGSADVHLPHDDPFVIYSRRFAFCGTTQYLRERGGMMRVCDLRSTLGHLTPELDRRLPEGASGLYLETDIGAAGLRRGSRGLEVVDEPVGGLPRLTVPQRLLVTLLVGYRAVAEVLSDPACHADPGAQEVAEALFPLRSPFVPGPDRF